MKAKVASRAGGDRLAVKKGKAEKDPNKPKRPPSAFFVFMKAFRKEYKEKNPNNKQVSVVGKAGGEKWKSMNDAFKFHIPACLYSEGFREYMDKNPNNKQVSVVGKAGGEKWKSLTDAEKAPYVTKAEKLKAAYAKKMDAYNNPQAEASGDSDKSKSEINYEEDGSEGDE